MPKWPFAVMAVLLAAVIVFLVVSNARDTTTPVVDEGKKITPPPPSVATYGHALTAMATTLHDEKNGPPSRAERRR